MKNLFTHRNSRSRFLGWRVRARCGLRCKAQTIAIPNGIGRICNAAARPSDRAKNHDLEFRWVYNNHGFTLLELIIALAIAALFSSLAAPAFNDFIQQTRLTSATYALHNAMNLARIEAIKRNSRVDLIALEGSWKNGWVIIADNQPVMNHEALHDDIHVETNLKYQTTPYISYSGTGRTRTQSSNDIPQFGTIRLSAGHHARLIVVNFLGRVRVCNPATAPATSCVNSASDK